MGRGHRSWTGRTLAVVALLATAVAVVGADAPPAGAATSTVSVSPSTGLRDGDTVAVTVSAADFASHTIFQCDAAYLTDATNPYPSLERLTTHCVQLIWSFTAEPGTTATVDVIALESFNTSAGDERITCGDAPDDCILVDVEYTIATGPIGVGGYAPVTFERTPTLTISPTPARSSPWTATATGTLFRREPVTMAQCSQDWAASPDQATADASCGAPVTVTPDQAGGFSTTITLTDPLVARDGGSVPCGRAGCYLVAGYADEPVRVSTVSSFAPISTVSVSPATGLRDGDTVAVTVTDADFPDHSIVQCDAAYLTAATDPYPTPLGVLDHCTLPLAQFTADPGTTTTVDVVVRESFTPVLSSRQITCGDAPDDCILVDLDHVTASFPAGAGGYAPISLERTVTLTVSPIPAWSSPWAVTVTGTQFRREPVTLAQCSATWAASPDPATADASCGAPLAVTPDPAGGFSATMTLTDPVVARNGDSVPCGLDGCSVVASYADEPVRASSATSFAVPTFTASPTSDLGWDATTAVTIRGVPGPTARVSLCTDIPPGPEVPGGRFCFPPYDQTVNLTDGAGAISFPVHDGRYAGTTVPGTESLDCREIECYLAAFTSTGEQIDEPIPVTFSRHPFVTLGSSADGWDEGTVAQLHGDQLPSYVWYVDVCNLSATSCEPSTVAFAGGMGPYMLNTPVTLTQAPGNTARCRPTCMVRARSYLLLGPTLTATYSVPSPAVAVAPASGLTDGQSVEVTGTGMMKSYPGRQLFLPTGGWAVALCDGSIGAVPSLADILLRCAAPAGGAPVTVTDHTSVNTVTVPAQLTASVGGATFDCTTSAGACKLGLVRWEQDGTVTAILQALTFSTG